MKYAVSAIITYYVMLTLPGGKPLPNKIKNCCLILCILAFNLAVNKPAILLRLCVYLTVISATCAPLSSGVVGLDPRAFSKCETVER